MSERQRGLGRGLSALLGEAALDSPEAPAGAAPAEEEPAEAAPAEDVELVMSQTGCDAATARKALQESGGQPAEAILKIMTS